MIPSVRRAQHCGAFTVSAWITTATTVPVTLECFKWTLHSLNHGFPLFLAWDNTFCLSTASPAFLDLPFFLCFSRRRRELADFSSKQRDIMFRVLNLVQDEISYFLYYVTNKAMLKQSFVFRPHFVPHKQQPVALDRTSQRTHAVCIITLVHINELVSSCQM